MLKATAAALVASLALALSVTSGCATDDGGDNEYEVHGEDDDGKADQAPPAIACVDPASGQPESEDCVISWSVGRAASKFLTANPRLYELRGGHTSFDTCAGYHEHVYERDFTVPPERVIAAIANSQPKELWNGSSSYKLSYDHNTSRVYGPDDVHPPLTTGMVFVLSLKIAPLIYIPVAFEIVELDPAAGRFAFSYVVQNKSQGIQQLTITPTATGSHLRHETRYDSDSDFRDDHLYVPFHEKLLAEFYAALDRKLAAE